jgi:hypothetical protein
VSRHPLLDRSLPGSDLVVRGLEDLAAGRESAEALLVAIGRPPLVRPGLEVLIRRLVSFETAAESLG